MANPNVNTRESLANGLMISGDFTGAVPTDIDTYAPGCVLYKRDNSATYTNIGSSSSPNFSRSSFSRIIPNTILANWDYGIATATAASASDFTYHTTFTVEHAATRFRFAFHNMNAGTSDITSGKISVSNAVGADPTIGSTTGQARFTPSTATWVNLTWAGGATSVTLAARVSATVPSITWTDWIDISTIPRTDGGTLPVVMMRFLVPSSGTTNPYTIGTQTCGLVISNAANRGALANTFTNGRLKNSIRYTGDGVTTPTTFQPTTDFGYVMFAGMEYQSKQPGYTMLVNGDSIAYGAVNGSTANYGNGWMWQVTQLLRAIFPSTPIEIANIGVSSTATGTFLTRLNAYIAAGGRFDFAYYCPASPNDGTPTQALINTMMNNMAQGIDVLKTANKPYFISTPCPNTALAWNSTADGFRLQMRTEMLLSRNSGVSVIDFETIGDGATPVRFNTLYSTDGTHPNEAGHAVLAAQAVNEIAKFL